MKRFIVAAALVLMSLCFGRKAHAVNFGVVGGFDFYSPASNGMPIWHAGAVVKVDLPLGFQIQPSLVYNVKETGVLDSEAKGVSAGFLQLTASAQWGADLILLRPFVEVSPFVGCGLNVFQDSAKSWTDLGGRMDYGVGVGGGLQIWRFQLSARYNWVVSRPSYTSLSLAFFF